MFLGNGSRKRAKGPRNLGEARWFLAQTARQGQAKSGQEGAKRDQETAKIEVRAVVDSGLPRRDEEAGSVSPRRAFKSEDDDDNRRQRPPCGKADATCFLGNGIEMHSMTILENP